MTRWLPRWADRPIVALVSLGSGAALLAAIFTGISLRFTLLAAIGLWIVVAGYIWIRGREDARRAVAITALAGAAAGLVATLLYDASRWALSHLDPAPYNPYEAIRVFGLLLTGSGADAHDAGVMTVGIAYHLFNGTTFGIAYALLLARRDAGVGWALLTGTAWGLGLEMFQITIYPGWLDIRAYDEFLRVSFLGHVVYGAALGVGSRTLLQRLSPASAEREPERPPPRFTGLHTE